MGIFIPLKVVVLVREFGVGQHAVRQSRARWCSMMLNDFLMLELQRHPTVITNVFYSPNLYQLVIPVWKSAVIHGLRLF